MGRNILRTSGNGTIFRLSAVIVLALVSTTSLLNAQNGPRQGQRGGPPGAGGDRGGSFDFFKDMPFLQAVDENGDGELSFEELENAGTALKTLDKNGDRKLTLEEVRPSGGPRNVARRPQNRGTGGRPGAQAGGRRPGGSGRPDGNSRPGGGNSRRGNGPLPGGDPVPASPVNERVERLLALDSDGNGLLDPNEIGATLVEKGDKDADGSLSKSEIEAIVTEEANGR